MVGVSPHRLHKKGRAAARPRVQRSRLFGRDLRYLVLAAGEHRFEILTLHDGDIIERDLFRAGGFALTDIRTMPETCVVHRVHHTADSASLLGLTLRHQRKLRDLRTGEE